MIVDALILALLIGIFLLLMRVSRRFTSLWLFCGLTFLWGAVSVGYNNIGYWNYELGIYTGPSSALGLLAAYIVSICLAVFMFSTKSNPRPGPVHKGVLMLIAIPPMVLVLLLLFEVMRGNNVAVWGFDRVAIYQGFSPLTESVLGYAFICHFLTGVISTYRRLGSFFLIAFLLCYAFFGVKFSGIFDVLFWYILGATLSGYGSIFNLLARSFKLVIAAFLLFLILIFSSYFFTDSGIVFELLKARVFQFQGQLWWYLFNFPPDSRAATLMFCRELSAINDCLPGQFGGLSQMMVFALGEEKVFYLQERGYLYTFGFPAVFLAMGIPYAGIYVSFLLAAVVTLLIRSLKSEWTVFNYFYNILVVSLLSPILNFMQTGSVPELLTLGLFIKLILVAGFEIERIHQREMPYAP